MKILQINQCHYPRGGADKVYLNHIELLTKMGHDVAAFSTHNDRNVQSDFKDFFVETKDLRNVSIVDKVRSVIPYLYNYKALRKLRKLIKEFKPDIAHVHLFYANLSVSVLKVLSDEKVPILHTVHDYRLLCPVNTMLDNTGKICNKCAGKSVWPCVQKKCSENNLGQSIVVALEGAYWRNIISPVSLINQFHFVSEFCMKEHFKYYPEIAHNSVKLCNFAPLNAEVPVFSKKDRYYLYFGRLSYEKGLMTLIKAWSILPANMKLKIVGEGPVKSEVEFILKNKNLDNIELSGYKKGNELQDLVRNAMFVIVPSEWFENNPMTIIESYKLGTPAIGASIGGIPEIIESNKTGFVFKSGDVVDLAQNIKYADDLSDSAYRDMQMHCNRYAETNFSEESYYKSLISIYNKTINELKISKI
jgi:glycosyltransferase involved in cell wall biosynthesis